MEVQYNLNNGTWQMIICTYKVKNKIRTKITLKFRMIRYNGFINKSTLFTKFYTMCLLLFIYLALKTFTSVLDLNHTNIIWCLDLNDLGNIPIGFFTDIRTIGNLGINGGAAYAAYRGAMHFSGSLAGAPLHIRTGVFVATYAGIYGIRTLLPNNPLNLNLYIGNFDNGGNRFNSPLEYGEALNNSSIFMDGMIILNSSILLLFHILVIILANRTMGPFILKWLENKLGNNNLIFILVERTYKANMKVTVWLIGFIIIMLYIFMLFDLWGLTRIKIAITMIIENIDNIFSKPKH